MSRGAVDWFRVAVLLTLAALVVAGSFLIDRILGNF